MSCAGYKLRTWTSLLLTLCWDGVMNDRQRGHGTVRLYPALYPVFCTLYSVLRVEQKLVCTKCDCFLYCRGCVEYLSQSLHMLFLCTRVSRAAVSVSHFNRLRSPRGVDSFCLAPSNIEALLWLSDSRVRQNIFGSGSGWKSQKQVQKTNLIWLQV